MHEALPGDFRDHARLSAARPRRMKWLALAGLALSGAALAGPQYDFLFETGDRFGVIYTVRRGFLEKDESRASEPSPHPARLYLYDTATDRFREVSFEEARRLKLVVMLDPLKSTAESPDGFRVVRLDPTSHDPVSAAASTAALKLRGIDARYFHLEKGSFRHKLKLPSDSREFYNPVVLGWVPR